MAVTGDTPLRKVTVAEAAAYFQGKGSFHNHPMICCTGNYIIVATELGIKRFKPQQLDKALAFFRARLEEMAYYS